VKHVKAGDLVINLQRENWTQRRKVRGDDAIRCPPASILRRRRWWRINPPTAQLMLSDFRRSQGRRLGDHERRQFAGRPDS